MSVCAVQSILIEINPILLFLQLCAVQSSILIEINPILLFLQLCAVYFIMRSMARNIGNDAIIISSFTIHSLSVCIRNITSIYLPVVVFTTVLLCRRIVVHSNWPVLDGTVLSCGCFVNYFISSSLLLLGISNIV